MPDWFGILDVVFGALNTTQKASDEDTQKTEQTEEVEKKVKKQTEAIVEKRLDEMEKRREKSDRLVRQDHHRMKR